MSQVYFLCPRPLKKWNFTRRIHNLCEMSWWLGSETKEKVWNEIKLLESSSIQLLIDYHIPVEISSTMCVSYSTVLDQQAAHVRTRHFQQPMHRHHRGPNMDQREALPSLNLSTFHRRIDQCTVGRSFRFQAMVVSGTEVSGVCPAHETAGKLLTGWKRRQPQRCRDYPRFCRRFLLCGLVK